MVLRKTKTKKRSQITKTVPKKSYTWHSHDFREVLSVLGSNNEGLVVEEVLHRQKKFGLNKFSEVKEKGLVQRIIEQLKSPLAFVLVLAFFATAILEEFIDAGVILFALLIAVFVGIAQEGKASKAFKKLADSQVHTATVLRAGEKHEVIAEELVPGDVVEIQSGGQVPADVRLIFAKKLSVNEAALTGEWLAVDKTEAAVAVGTPFAERSSMAWMGTFVADGYGLGVVVATGDKTAIGELATGLTGIEDEQTPLQLEMKRISMIMLYIIAALVTVIFAIGLWQGQSVHDMLLTSIAVAVASVPEGLPAAVTIILAVGMEALLKRGGLVRNLLAAETLGSTTFVLTDKTGTLTEAKMTLTSIVTANSKNAREEFGGSEEVRNVIDIALCASNAYRDKTETKTVLRGDPVEKAILHSAQKVGLSVERDSLRGNRVDVLPFSSENRFAAGLAEVKGAYRLCINGAPEYLLERASTVMINGETVALDNGLRDELLEKMEVETSQGKRLVGVSFKLVDFDDIPDAEAEAAGLLDETVFVGILVLNDPVREGVREAIQGVKEAGAEVMLVTGDNPVTALSIAREVGIASDSEGALTGNDLVDLSDEEIMKAMETVHVFARVLPKQKLRLAQVLQSYGEVVAMTGDGINDAPALKKANIGVAIGSGTEVAKESSDLVLLNDGFQTIYAAIEEGRRIISNLRKIVGYLLSTSLSEVVLIGAALLFGAPVPILPAQILWANVIEEGLMSVAFAFEGGDKDAMQKRPEDIRDEGILSKGMMWFIAFVVTVLGFMILALYFFFRMQDFPIDQLRSAMFLSVAIDSLFMAFAFRSLTTPFWLIPLRTNFFFVGSFLISLVLLFISVSVPFFQFILSYTPLPVEYILVIFAFGLVSLLVIEFSKWLFFERQRQVTIA